MYNLLFVATQVLTFPQQNDICLEVVGKSEQAPWAFFAPHENEFVANAYVANKIKQYGGVFVMLRQRGSRYVVLTFDNKELFIDPNRMFTPLGITDSLKKLNPELNLELATDSLLFKQAVARATLLGRFVIKQLGGVYQNSPANRGKTWVAMHNNTQGYEGDNKSGVGDVSIYRYQKKLKNGAQYLIDVAQSRHAVDEDDLFYVTERADFQQMKKHDWNVVLQNPVVITDPEEDDGSLSVYAQKHGVRYINIEAERALTLPSGKIWGENHLAIQQKMVDFTFQQLTRSTQKIQPTPKIQPTQNNAVEQ